MSGSVVSSCSADCTVSEHSFSCINDLNWDSFAFPTSVFRLITFDAALMHKCCRQILIDSDMFEAILLMLQCFTFTLIYERLLSWHEATFMLFNRYRAFRQAVLWAVRFMWHAVGCASWAKLRRSWADDFVAFWNNFEAMLVNIEAILWLSWGLLVMILKATWPKMQKGQTKHTSLKCKNRSRITLVQRKRPPQNRRCYQTLKLHTLWKCKNRSRITLVQRKCSHDITQVQKR